MNKTNPKLVRCRMQNRSITIYHARTTNPLDFISRNPGPKGWIWAFSSICRLLQNTIKSDSRGGLRAGVRQLGLLNSTRCRHSTFPQSALIFFKLAKLPVLRRSLNSSTISPLFPFTGCPATDIERLSVNLKLVLVIRKRKFSHGF